MAILLHAECMTAIVIAGHGSLTRKHRKEIPQWEL